jgi:hypothetical protein
VLGEGLEPPQTLRSSGLQPEAIAATRTQRFLILSNFEPSVRFGLTTCCLQNSCSTTELRRHLPWIKSDFIKKNGNKKAPEAKVEK